MMLPANLPIPLNSTLDRSHPYLLAAMRNGIYVRSTAGVQRGNCGYIKTQFSKADSYS